MPPIHEIGVSHGISRRRLIGNALTVASALTGTTLVIDLWEIYKEKIKQSEH